MTQLCSSQTLCRAAATAILFSLAVLPAAVAAQSGVETFVLFDPSVPETPESIVFDRFDNAYVTLSLSGEVRKIAPDGTQSTVAFLPLEPPCETPFIVPVSVLGLAIDHQDKLYAPISSCNPANQGLWKVDPESGTIQLLANAPSFTVWNGVDVYNGFVYIADTFDGLIWRVPTDGGLAEIWADHPLLKRPPGVEFPGPNGIRFFHHELYVANTVTSRIIVFPLEEGDMPGPPRVHAVLPGGQVPDEFTFDVNGTIYCATQPFNTLVRIDPDGTSEILLTIADGLDGPSSAAFGRVGENRKNLYITNAALPLFTTTFRPSLMRLSLEVPGAPR